MDTRDTVRSMLTGCDDPVAAIEIFQSSHAFTTPAIDTALPLLDLLGATRHEFHSRVLSKLTETLLTKLAQIPHEQKVKILGEMIPLAGVDPVQSLLAELLSSFKSVPEQFLEQLADNPKAYKCCPVRVKRHIWEKNNGLFGEELRQLFDKYIAEKETMLLSLQESETSFFAITPRTRRQHPIVNQLVEMVGMSPKLYEVLCSFLRVLFGQYGKLHYCTLRIDVLMVLHEAGQSNLTRQDPCWRFIWSLDAWVREPTLDEKRVKELSTYMNQQEDAVGGDMAMVLREPSILHLLCTSTIGLLGDLAKQCRLPRESSTLRVLLRLLNVGMVDLDMLQADGFSEPPLEHDVIHRHMAILVSICADMDAIALYTTLQFETGTSDTEFYEQMLQPLPDSFSRVLSTSPLALVLTVHLAARTAKRGCSKSLQRLIHSLSTCKLTSKIPCTVWYYFLLEVSKLSKFVLTENVMDSLGSNLLALFIFEGLIVPLCLNQRNCLGHCLRLLTVWPPSARTAVASAADESWFEILRPNDQHSDTVWELYSTAFAACGWQVEPQRTPAAEESEMAT